MVVGGAGCAIVGAANLAFGGTLYTANRVIVAGFVLVFGLGSATLGVVLRRRGRPRSGT
jgi:hypothetical protein